MSDEDEDDLEIDLRIILLGDTSTNKHKFLLKYLDEEESKYKSSYIFADIYGKHIYMKGMNINLSIKDTAGQERYRHLALSYLKRAHGAILLYDITNKSTFDSLINYYIKNIEEINPN